LPADISTSLRFLPPDFGSRLSALRRHDPERDQSPSSRGSSAVTTPGSVAPSMILRSREGSQPVHTPRDGNLGWHPAGEPESRDIEVRGWSLRSTPGYRCCDPSRDRKPRDSDFGHLDGPPHATLCHRHAATGHPRAATGHPRAAAGHPRATGRAIFVQRPGIFVQTAGHRRGGVGFRPSPFGHLPCGVSQARGATRLRQPGPSRHGPCHP
jgi:hypothetical protein